MRVCDLCGKRYHEGIAVFGAGDDPLVEMDLCESHYLLIQKMIRELFEKAKAEVLAS